MPLGRVWQSIFGPKPPALEPVEPLEITYQPIVNLATGFIDKCEALCRPPGAGVDLAAYVAEAERTGSIQQFNERVIDETLADWRNNGPQNVALSINMSVTNLSEADLVQRIEKALVKHRFEAKRLWFEFDGRAQSTDDAAMLARLAELNKLGVRLSIDSFGAEFTQATLYEVERLHVGELKVDGRYVRDADADMRHRDVITATVKVAQHLHIGVSAKGIENESISALMLRLGCTHGQGYYFARPMDAGAIGALVDELARSGPLPTGR